MCCYTHFCHLLTVLRLQHQEELEAMTLDTYVMKSELQAAHEAEIESVKGALVVESNVEVRDQSMSPFE